jgi:hypothetical protein
MPLKGCEFHAIACTTYRHQPGGMGSDGQGSEVALSSLESEYRWVVHLTKR